MNGLIIGMDLCDSCTHISCQGQETIWSVPTRIGKEPDSDVWRVVEESAGGALEGMVVEDKLLSLAMKDGHRHDRRCPLRGLISAENVPEAGACDSQTGVRKRRDRKPGDHGAKA